MLNILFNPKKAERHPMEMMLVGFFYASLSIFLGMWVFPGHASITMVFLTMFSCLYVIQGAIRKEEKNESNYKSEGWLLKKHSKTIYFLLFLFLGFVFAFTFWTIILPAEKTTLLFEIQKSSIEGIKDNVVSGNAVDTGSTLAKIFLNNIKVLGISLVFAIFYGAGAIFILAWNASVMGYLIGNLAENTFGIHTLPIIFTKYFVHGIPEILAYLVGALAGGILYVAIWRGDLLNEEKNKSIAIDLAILVGISVILLVAAAIIEVYISPLI